MDIINAIKTPWKSSVPALGQNAFYIKPEVYIQRVRYVGDQKAMQEDVGVTISHNPLYVPRGTQLVLKLEGDELIIEIQPNPA